MDIFTNFRNKFKTFFSKVGITEKDVKEIIKELQKTLISTDVDVKLTFELSKKIEEKIYNEKNQYLTLKQKTIKALYESLEEMLGKPYELKIKKQTIMLIGLYGSGKTTTAGKLALFFKKKGLSVALLSLDDERPAAIEQLKQIAQKVNANFYYNKEHITKNRKEDVLIIDTAGKNAIDNLLLEKLKMQYEEIKPDEVWLVLQADIGKIAIEQVKGFSDVLPINAAIITKFDSSGKAGGCISALSRNGINIVFLGSGEKMDALIPYSTKHLIAKIFGLPNTEGLKDILEKAKEQINENNDETFNLETFYKQIKMFSSSSLQQLAANLGFYDMPKELLIEGEKKMKKFEAMINSMTKEERKNPEIVKKTPSRIKRIAKGSGLKEEEILSLLHEYFKAEKAFKKITTNKHMLKILARKFNFQ